MAKRQEESAVHCMLLTFFCHCFKIFQGAKIFMHATANITTEINFHLITYYIWEVMHISQLE